MSDISIKVEELTLLFNAFERQNYDEKQADTVLDLYVVYHLDSDVKDLHYAYLLRSGEGDMNKYVSVKYPANEVDLETEYRQLRWDQKNRKEKHK